MEAAVLYSREHGDLKVPFTYRVPGDDQAVEAEGWPASLAAFPLGARQVSAAYTFSPSMRGASAGPLM